jgi:hypothetical protein
MRTSIDRPVDSRCATEAKPFAPSNQKKKGENDSRCCQVFDHNRPNDPYANFLKLTHHHKGVPSAWAELYLQQSDDEVRSSQVKA